MRLPTEMTLAQIAAVMGGKVEGDANVKVSSVALSPLKATTGDIAFVFEKKLLSKTYPRSIKNVELKIVQTLYKRIIKDLEMTMYQTNQNTVIAH